MNNGIFGIDLGTTYSCIAYVDEFGKAVTIRNADGEMTTPSVVYFEDTEKQIVGTEAKTSMVMEPENTVAFIKREMGTDFRREIHGVSYSPQEISSKILKKVVGDANAALREQGILKQDEEIKKAVITCPAYFGMAEKDATKNAGIIAGLDVLDIINEPTAAAINYGVINADQKKNVLVYDLGGGTFDVTIISIGGNSINVVCTGGDPKLGGKDWDNQLKDYLVERWKKEMDTDEDISEDLETLSALMESAEKAKKTLSTKDTAKIIVNHEGERMKVEITREMYDNMTGRLLERTIELTNSCLTEAEKKGISLAQIDEILLVGGSSRMPQVKAMVEKTYGKPTNLFDPDEAVAKGAALYAQDINQYQIIIEALAEKTGKSTEQVEKEAKEGMDLHLAAKRAGVSLGCIPTGGKLDIKNVSSRTYGLVVLNEENQPVVANFVFQNDTLPNTVVKRFPMHGDSWGVSLELYESLSDQEILENYKELATEMTVFHMEFDNLVKKGTPIEIQMTLNNSGLITIDAEETKSHKKARFTFQIKNSLDENEMKSAMLRSSASKVE
ncbi:Hsp70 family protein [Clostridium sp.]